MKLKSLLPIALAAAGAALSVAPRAQAIDLTGAGATFPNPIYSKWFAEYKKVQPDVSFNYQPIGSGGGQKQILEGTVDFGASDGPMSDENLAKAPSKILHIPTVAGAVAVTYNLPGVKELKLDGPTLADIYLGKITKWNDPAIAKQNSGAKLPDQPIAVVHRADGSGTSYIFVDYLSKISPEWMSKVGKPNNSPNWPAGGGAKGNDGVSSMAQKVAGSIAYVELIYAAQNKLPVAEIKNAEGVYLKPTLEGITAAVATATIPDDFRFSMVNAPGKASYPISGVTWLLVYEQQKDAAKGKAFVGFLKWALTEGEKQAKALDYAPLPDEVQKRVLERINSIK
jgi:phosphate transport system substrate-binding protein